MLANGSRDGKPFNARHLFLTSLRTTPEALLRLIRERWSIESLHWIREGLQAVMHDIAALLAMAMRQPRERPS